LKGFQRPGGQTWLIAPPESEIARRALAAGISLLPQRFSKLTYPLQALRLAGWLRRKRIQVLNPHSSRDGWLLGIAGRLARVPLIIRTRHIDVDYPNRWISRHAFTTFADHVLTTSDRITRHFQEMFALPGDRITTVPTGIDIQVFSPTGPKATLASSTQEVPLIGMVSVLRSWKGHPLFLEAATMLRQAGFPAHYVIVGDGPQQAQIRDTITRLDLADVTTLTGHREDVPAILRALSVLVIPSTKHEGVPQIGLQALATRTPVVGSDVGGIPEIIRPGETGRIFPNGNAAALAAALRETLEQSRQTQAFSERGRALVETNHSLEVMLDKLDALYLRHLSAED
jgi:glycosyltransferase involved in cell wall biosynthesis